MSAVHSVGQSKCLYSAIFAVIGLMIGGGSAVAQQRQPTAEITIVAPYTITHKNVGRNYWGAPIEVVSLTHRVSYGDLDLRKESDVSTLNARVSEAAKTGCNELDKLYPLDKQTSEANRTCAKVAVHGAEPQVTAAIAAAGK